MLSLPLSVPLLFFVCAIHGHDLSHAPAASADGKNELQSQIVDSLTAEGDRNSLGPALRVLHRRKRESVGANRPYSAYRPLAGSHSPFEKTALLPYSVAYRYPLYRKRSLYSPPDEGNNEEPFLSDLQDTYDDYSDDYQGPSLFRERERGPKAPLINNAYFSNNPTKKFSHSSHSSQQQQRKKSPYSLSDIPYDLNTMGRLYEQGKRVRNPPIMSRNMPSSDRFFDTLDAISSKPNNNYYRPINLDDENDEKMYSNVIKNAIKEYNKGLSPRDIMIRRKRSSASLAGLSSHSSMFNDKAQNKSKTLNQSNEDLKENVNDKDYYGKQTDRQKRAFDDTTKYMDSKRMSEAENDFLTREYFKTIARSVGNKRKRMAFAQFESHKRSSGFDAFLENPSMLHYVQEQLKDAEEEVAQNAEKEFKSSAAQDEADPKSKILLSNTIARLDALESMREALYQLERLQEKEIIRKRAANLADEYDDEEIIKNQMDKEKRRKALNGRQDEEEDNKGKKRDDAIEKLFRGNKRDECPVLDRIVLNCVSIAEMVGDDNKVFLEPCLRHEICYMCGSGYEVSSHECDALLSSALEAACADFMPGSGSGNGSGSGSLDCLSAAGDTYEILGDPKRYDGKGACTFDPCVRQLLDTR